MTDEIFEKLTSQALESLPEEFKEKLENVEIIIEDFPDEQTINTMNLPSKWYLLGLYVGIPITHRSVFSMPNLPERIHIYRKPIIRAAGNPQRIPGILRDVLMHEIGHHFGFDEDDLDRMDL